MLCLAMLCLAMAPAEARTRPNGKSIPPTAQLQAPPPPGPHHLIVSLDRQRASLYANGVLVARTPISSGKPSHPTPTGIFSVIQKNRHHRSNLYSGAPMPFMQRLTWSGIALHQGALPGYPASHGCIRLPGDFAQSLWRTTRLGARVIVAHAETEPAAIAHPLLARLEPPPATLEAAPVLRRSIGTEIAANSAAALASDATDGVASDAPARPATASEAAIPAPILASFFESLDTRQRKLAPAGPVSIFISRKDGQLYVRRGFEALFSVPFALRAPGERIGTHVFTALGAPDAETGLRWIAIGIPAQPDLVPQIARPEPRGTGRRGRPAAQAGAATEKPARPTPAEALDRIDLPQDLAERLAGYVTAGATLIVSDHGISSETGAYTDFIVLTR